MIVSRSSAAARAACLTCVKDGYRAYECGQCAAKPTFERVSKCLQCMTSGEGLRNPGNCIFIT
jgi:hypothetical protein